MKRMYNEHLTFVDKVMNCYLLNYEEIDVLLSSERYTRVDIVYCGFMNEGIHALIEFMSQEGVQEKYKDLSKKAKDNKGVEYLKDINCIKEENGHLIDLNKDIVDACLIDGYLVIEQRKTLYLLGHKTHSQKRFYVFNKLV